MSTPNPTTLLAEYHEWSTARSALMDGEADTGDLDIDALHSSDDAGLDLLASLADGMEGLERRLDVANRVAAECWEALGDNAFRFTCQEAELIASFLNAFGGPGEEFLTLHAEGDDDPDDLHHGGVRNG